MKMTAFSKYHLQNICHFQNMPTSACSVGRGALPGLGTPHFYITALQEGGKKKIHNIPHTSLGSLFSLSRIKCCWHLSPRFPEWAWRQNYADSQTHTRFLFPAQLSAANLQLFFIFSKGPSAYKRSLREALKIDGAFLFACLESFSPGKSQERDVHIIDVQEGSAHSYSKVQ